MPLRRLTPEQFDLVANLLENGVRQNEIATLFNVSPSVINRAKQRLLASGSARITHGGGRERVTSAAEDRILVRCARGNPTFCAKRLRDTAGFAVSLQTVRNRLHERQLRARRRFKCPRLTRAHRISRRMWAQQHSRWTIDQWRRCLFADETRFGLYGSDGRILVWREPGTRHQERNMAPQEPFQGGSVMVWGGISYDDRTNIVLLLNGTITGQRYRDHIILPNVVPFFEQHGQDMTFVDDNARPHRARMVNEALIEHNVTRMEWPPRSPDCNPIEHIWSYMKKKLLDRNEAFHHLQQLANAVVEEWQAVPQRLIARLISSMPSRVRAVLRARGGPTRY